MTNQEVFNIVYKGAMKQQVKCANSMNTCLYRMGNLKCFAGFLIEDKDYTEEFEGDTASYGAIGQYFKSKNINALFVEQLQTIHDENKVEMWKDKLIDFARLNNLTVPQD